jgi:hypothetical protein
MSLKSQIYQEVKRLGYCPLDIIHGLAEQGGYKQSTAEKKCRELAEIKSIVPVYNDKGYLTAYRMPSEAQNCDYSGFQPKVEQSTTLPKIISNKAVYQDRLFPVNY